MPMQFEGWRDISRWKWFGLIPLLAAVLVFTPGLLGPSKKTNEVPEAEPVWRSSGAGDFTSMLQIALALVFVLGLVAIAVVLLRRMQLGKPQDSGGEIQIKESRRLSPRRTLHILRASDRILLVAESEQGVHLLSDLTPADPMLDPVATVTAEPPAEAADEDDDGAVPRDLVIPRANARPRKPAKPGTFRELLNRLG